MMRRAKDGIAVPSWANSARSSRSRGSPGFVELMAVSRSLVASSGSGQKMLDPELYFIIEDLMPKSVTELSSIYDVTKYWRSYLDLLDDTDDTHVAGYMAGVISNDHFQD
jgi:hypothetical protein